MSDDSSGIGWGIAAVAFVGAVVLLGVGFVTTGVPRAPLGNSETRVDQGPDAEIDFRPNPNSLTLYYAGGDAVVGDTVYVVVEGEPNRTWTGLDPDLQSNQPLDAGEKVSLPSWEPGDDVRLVWEDEDDERAVIATYDA